MQTEPKYITDARRTKERAEARIAEYEAEMAAQEEAEREEAKRMAAFLKSTNEIMDQANAILSPCPFCGGAIKLEGGMEEDEFLCRPRHWSTCFIYVHTHVHRPKLIADADELRRYATSFAAAWNKRNLEESV